MIAKRLKYLLNEHGWTHKEFAKMSGISPPTLSRILNGKQACSARLLDRMALLLDVSKEYLNGEADDRGKVSDGLQRFKNYNLQTKTNNDLIALLKTMGLQIKRYLIIGVDEYEEDGFQWRHKNDAKELNAVEALDKIETSSEYAEIIYIIKKAGEEIRLTLDEFNAWARRYIAMIELMLQGDFDQLEDIRLRPIEGDEERVIRKNHERVNK